MNDKQNPLMLQLKELVTMLNKIRRTYASDRLKTIGELQHIIWDAPELQTEELYFLQDLAGDLNFYEPVERDRDSSLGYYSESRLLELTAAALNTIVTLLAPR